MRIPILVWQLLPIAIVLLPFFEAVVFAIYWRQSVSSPWLYGLAGVVVAYAIAIGSVFVAEQYSSREGHVVTAYFVETPETKNIPTTKSQDKPLRFAPLTLAWTALLIFIVAVSGVVLWALKFIFTTEPT
jgi:hypothetical protein